MDFRYQLLKKISENVSAFEELLRMFIIEGTSCPYLLLIFNKRQALVLPAQKVYIYYLGNSFKKSSLFFCKQKTPAAETTGAYLSYHQLFFQHISYLQQRQLHLRIQTIFSLRAHRALSCPRSCCRIQRA